MFKKRSMVMCRLMAAYLQMSQSFAQCLIKANQQHGCLLANCTYKLYTAIWLLTKILTILNTLQVSGGFADRSSYHCNIFQAQVKQL